MIGARLGEWERIEAIRVQEGSGFENVCGVFNARVTSGVRTDRIVVWAWFSFHQISETVHRRKECGTTGENVRQHTSHAIQKLVLIPEHRHGPTNFGTPLSQEK